MKRLLVVVLLCGMLCGCSGGQGEMDRVLALRTEMGKGSLSFDAVIVADYVDALYTFSVQCCMEQGEKLTFCVKAPETIAGITGTVDASGGKLTFDQAALAFALLADGQLNPASAPYILMKALLGGYITSCATEGDMLRATIRDSYADDAFTVDIWIDKENQPVRGEILYDNRRILTVEVENFSIG